MVKKFYLVIYICLIQFNIGFAQSKYKVYTAMIGHFTKYVQWPATNRTEIVIDIIDNPDLNTEMQILNGKSLGNLKIIVKHSGKVNEIAENSIVYIGEFRLKDIASHKAEFLQKHVLLITDIPNGTSKGAVINFVEIETKVKFEVSLKIAEEFGVKISSDLQKMAIVKD